MNRNLAVRNRVEIASFPSEPADQQKTAARFTLSKGGLGIWQT